MKLEGKNEFERVFWLVMLLIAAVVIVGLVASYFFAGHGFLYGIGMMAGYAYPISFMVLFMSVPLILLFIFIYWIIRIANGPHEVHHYHSNTQQIEAGQGRAREILDEKYANGDLTREQYLQMREDLLKR
jgi:uncharacterized membrane protein